ncbi:MAG: hypothetical protein MPW15_00250 [Candidatus Manganitrophus sp.]|nr:hypothetical protein [Candidatus Manganitrophus sp.]
MKRDGEIILGRIKWLMTLRILLVTSLLGIPLLLELNYLKNPWSIATFYFLIGSTYFLTLVYALFISRTRYPLFFVSVQLGIDLLFETALIVVTGGLRAPSLFFT